MCILFEGCERHVLAIASPRWNDHAHQYGDCTSYFPNITRSPNKSFELINKYQNKQKNIHK